MPDDLDVAALVDRRLAETEHLKQMPPPPPPMSETNRLLADAYQARQAKLNGEAQAEMARRKAAEEAENLRRFEAWLADEPLREQARVDIATYQKILAALNRRARRLDTARAGVRNRIRDLNQIASS